MTEITEADAIEYVKQLYELEKLPHHATATITFGPFTAFSMIGALQLALRHPEFSTTQAALVNSIIDQLRPLFANTPGEQLLKLGDNPAYDIPRDCRYPKGQHSPLCPPGDHAGFRGRR